MALITESYRSQQRELHEKNPSYGTASLVFAPLVASQIRRLDVRELLDYGAGKCRLRGALDSLQLDVNYYPFEPAIEALSAAPEPREMVACLDVLEHVEPECLDDVLDDLRRLTRRVGVFTVHTGPAQKTLSDGRNAHLIQRPPEWWLPRFFLRFDVVAFQKVDNGFFVIVEPLRS